MAHAGRRTDISRWRSIMDKLQHKIDMKNAAEKKAAQKKKEDK